MCFEMFYAYLKHFKVFFRSLGDLLGMFGDALDAFKKYFWDVLNNFDIFIFTFFKKKKNVQKHLDVFCKCFIDVLNVFCMRIRSVFECFGRRLWMF